MVTEKLVTMVTKLLTWRGGWLGWWLRELHSPGEEVGWVGGWGNHSPGEEVGWVGG